MATPDNIDQSQQLFSGHCEYEIFIYNYRGKQFRIDSSSILEFNIFETLFDDNVMKGDITLLDAVGFEEAIPIVGQEEIFISFYSTKMPKTKFAKTFTIYKMSERIIKERKQIYKLYFISKEFLINLKTKFSKSYKGKYANEIIRDIYDNHISKNIDISERKPLVYNKVNTADSSFFKNHYVFPYVRPFQAINMVAKNSVATNINLGSSENIPTPNLGSFIFFENQTGFWFKSIGDLLDPQFTVTSADINSTKIDATYEKGLDVNQLNETNTQTKIPLSIEEAPKTVSSSIPVTHYFIRPQNIEGYTFSSNDLTVISYKFKSTFDVMSNIIGGMYGSKLLTYDPITQMIGEDHYNNGQKVNLTNDFFLKSSKKMYHHEYHYLNEVHNFRHIREIGIENTAAAYGPLVGQYHVGLGNPEALYQYKSTNHLHNQKKQISLLDKIMTGNTREFAKFDNNVERYLLPLYAQKQSLQNILIDITVSGDHNRRVGEIVGLKLPSYRYENEEHTYYRGNYLISKLRHNIKGDGIYTTEMELVKDVLFTPLEEWEPTIIREDGALTGENTVVSSSSVPGTGNSQTNPSVYPYKPGENTETTA